MGFPGPSALGRGVVVVAGSPVPAPFDSVGRIVVDEAVLADPAAVVDQLHQAWLQRRPVVVELGIDDRELRQPEVCRTEPYRLDPGFSFERERLHFLVWANNYDLRRGEPVWWWAHKAARAGASLGGPADVVLADGSPAWCDGGPHQPFDEADPGLQAAVVHREAIERGRLTRLSYRSPSASLAPDQLAAVDHRVGPARVIAPAGSGKTRVLTERIRHLLVDRSVEPDALTAVAYNRRAASELTERTAGLGCNIRTIHSLALAICEGRIGPARPHRAVIEESQVRRVLEGLVPVRRQANTDVLAPYLEALSLIRLSLVDPHEAEERVADAEGIAEAFPRFRQILDAKGWLDFDEQIYLAIEILLSDPAARAAAQQAARHLLVDEFQDLTPAYLLLLRIMAAPGYQVFGVGDDDQVIYAYAGASPEYLIDYQRYFPGAQQHALEVNYRCPDSIVDAARCLLTHNFRRVEKTMRAFRQDQPADSSGLGFRLLETSAAARVVCELVASWHEAGASFSDVAVLARVNSALLAVQFHLAEGGIPCDRPLDESLLGRTGVRTALAYLRIALEPERISRSDLFETVRRPSRRIAPVVTEMMTDSEFTSIARIRGLAGRLTGGDGPKLESYADDLQALAKAADRGGTAAILRAVRVEVGLGAALDVLDASRPELDRSAHADDLDALWQVGALHPDASTFEAWLRQGLRRQGDADGVTLSTVHRVKGREWPLVVVFAANAGLFPHRLASSTEEERRVFHVAITRARQEVVVLADAASPSRFLEESRHPHRIGAPVAENDPLRQGADGNRRARASKEDRSAKRPSVGGRTRPPDQLTGVDATARFDKLAAWRKTRSAKDGVPAFVVFSDAALRVIADVAPEDLVALSRCWGVGPAKLERYGDELLAVLGDLEVLDTSLSAS